MTTTLRPGRPHRKGPSRTMPATLVAYLMTIDDLIAKFVQVIRPVSSGSAFETSGFRTSTQYAPSSGWNVIGSIAHGGAKNSGASARNICCTSVLSKALHSLIWAQPAGALSDRTP